MNKETFSEAMNQIDDRFYEEAGNYTHRQSRHSWVKWCAAAASAAIVLSGTAVVTANVLGFSPGQMAESMLHWGTRTTEPLESTPRQQEIYTSYSEALETAVELPSGVLHLDAICYDHSYINIPFRYYPNDRTYKPGESVAISALREDLSLVFIRKLNPVAADNEFLSDFYSNQYMAKYSQIDPSVSEDGALIGSFLLVIEGDRLSKGDHIQLYLGRIHADPNTEAELLTEFTLDKTPEVISISTEAFAGLPEQFTIEESSLSSLSLFIKGYTVGEPVNFVQFFDKNTTIVMKDKSSIGSADTGSLNASSHDAEKTLFKHQILFKEPIDLENAEWIHIDGISAGYEGVDLWIPIH